MAEPPCRCSASQSIASFPIDWSMMWIRSSFRTAIAWRHLFSSASEIVTVPAISSHPVPDGDDGFRQKCESLDYQDRVRKQPAHRTGRQQRDLLRQDAAPDAVHPATRCHPPAKEVTCPARHPVDERCHIVRLYREPHIRRLYPKGLPHAPNFRSHLDLLFEAEKMLDDRVAEGQIERTVCERQRRGIRQNVRLASHVQDRNSRFRQSHRMCQIPEKGAATDVQNSRLFINSEFKIETPKAHSPEMPEDRRVSLVNCH